MAIWQWQFMFFFPPTKLTFHRSESFKMQNAIVILPPTIIFFWMKKYKLIILIWSIVFRIWCKNKYLSLKLFFLLLYQINNSNFKYKLLNKTSQIWAIAKNSEKTFFFFPSVFSWKILKLAVAKILSRLGASRQNVGVGDSASVCLKHEMSENNEPTQTAKHLHTEEGTAASHPVSKKARQFRIGWARQHVIFQHVCVSQ